MTSAEYATIGMEEYEPTETFMPRDIISTVRSFTSSVSLIFCIWHQLIYDQVRASSLRRQHMITVQNIAGQKDLKLLRDVDTRWSSTFIMIDRFLSLREVILLCLK